MKFENFEQKHIFWFLIFWRFLSMQVSYRAEKLCARRSRGPGRFFFVRAAQLVAVRIAEGGRNGGGPGGREPPPGELFSDQADRKKYIFISHA